MARCRVLILSPDDTIARDISSIIDTIWVPIIKLKPIEGSSLNIINALRECRNIILTSPRTLPIIIEDAKNTGVLGELIKLIRESLIAVVGPRTENTLLDIIGKAPDIIPKEFNTRTLALELIERGVKCIVAPRSTEAVRDLDEIAIKYSIKLYDIKVYKPEVINDNIEKVAETIKNINIVLLTSPMIARLTCDIINKLKLENMTLIALGKSTAKSIGDNCRINYKLYVGDSSIESIKRILSSIIC
ncbi:MAG: uroporphyrinogen-III synthase [Acidilobaceae archaeon]